MPTSPPHIAHEIPGPKPSNAKYGSHEACLPCMTLMLQLRRMLGSSDNSELRPVLARDARLHSEINEHGVLVPGQECHENGKDRPALVQHTGEIIMNPA
eukprot:749914-Hanusia_phi.AAC.3